MDLWTWQGKRLDGNDTFSRTCYPNSDGRWTCDWCGSLPKRLYAYGNNHRHLFCNKKCAEAYHS